MAMLIHFAEIAALLAVSYALGLALGYGARWVSLRAQPHGAPSTIPPERLAAATGAQPPSVESAAATGGGEAPLPADTPLVSDQVPVAASGLDPQAATPVVPSATIVVEPAPEPLASQPSTASTPIETDLMAAPPLTMTDPSGPAMDPGASLLAAIEAEASSQGVAGPSLDILTADTPPAEPAPVEIQSAPTPPPPPVVPDGWTVAAPRVEAVPPSPPKPPVPTSRVPAPSSAPGVAWTGEIRGRAAPAPDMPPPALEAAPTLVPETPAPQLDAVAVAVSAPPPSDWTQRGAAASADLGAAVAAAQTAVEAALAKSGLDPAETEARDSAAFGKPGGLRSPLGGRDDLKKINGLKPEDESMLNGIGIFHFDQIAEWDHKEILWLENHVFERGRVARESWQEQAAELVRNRAETSGADL